MRATLVLSLLATAVLTTAVGSPATAETALPPPACSPDWTQVASPSPGDIYSDLLDVATIGAGDAWAVGFRGYIDGDDQFANSSIIERWDGSEWSVAYRPGSKGQLAGVFALATDDVWAVGHTGMESIDFQPLIMHWDGTTWSRVDSPHAAMGYLTAIGGAGPDDLWAAGTLIGTYDTIIEHWDGSSWTLVEHPSPHSDYVAIGGLAAGATDDVSIVGTYLDDQAKSAPLALRWNGTKWRRTQPVIPGADGTSLLDVTVRPNGRVWAVGNYVSGSETQAVAERWNGRTWTVALPPALPGSSALSSVTTGPDGVWAVGSKNDTGDAPTTLTERWRARLGEWDVVASPNASGDNYLLAVDQSPEGELWAVGFHRTGDQEKSLTEHRCGQMKR